MLKLLRVASRGPIGLKHFRSASILMDAVADTHNRWLTCYQRNH